jgi:hypothetical protein
LYLGALPKIRPFFVKSTYILLSYMVNTNGIIMDNVERFRRGFKMGYRNAKGDIFILHLLECNPARQY